MNKARTYKEMLEFVQVRSKLKRDVFELGKERFAAMQLALAKRMARLATDVQKVDPRLEISFLERNEYECACIVAGDYMLFQLHTNVFRVESEDPNHPNTAYLEADPSGAYCAVIHVYNFLADSFRYERSNDVGYLTARIFINHANHFFIEGISQIQTTFGHFSNSKFDGAHIDKVLLSVIYETLNFELIAPQFDQVAQLLLTSAIRTDGLTGFRTDKRLGFRLPNQID
jgi:hypothetical protein